MSIDEEIVSILRTRTGRANITADTALGASGLALDSIALVEVLLEVEQRFGIVIAAELLAGQPLTAGLLTERVRAAVPAR